MMKERENLQSAERIVVKVGTQVLMDEANITEIVAQMADLKQKGHEVVLVTSGAIGAGLKTLGIHKRPTQLADLQMAAAVGQTTLLQRYITEFQKHDCIVSQVLLTHADLKNRRRHLNARNAMLNLLKRSVIPIVNENDVVSVDEIQVGDNDLLSALVSVLIDADLLILLTSPNGLHEYVDGKPAKRIAYLKKVTQKTFDLVKPKNNPLSTGGMATKLQAARMTNKSGAYAVIASGMQQNVLTDILSGKDIGTLIGYQQSADSLAKRKRWLLYFHRPQGTLVIDDGAKKAIEKEGKSLLPIGVINVQGVFHAGSFVAVVDKQQRLVSQGLTEFSSKEIDQIKGQHSSKIIEILGPNQYDEIIHRDNMILSNE